MKISISISIQHLYHKKDFIEVVFPWYQYMIASTDSSRSPFSPETAFIKLQNSSRKTRNLSQKFSFNNSSSSPGNQSITFSSGSGTLWWKYRIYKNDPTYWFNQSLFFQHKFIFFILGENFQISLSVSQSQKQVSTIN